MLQSDCDKLVMAVDYFVCGDVAGISQLGLPAGFDGTKGAASADKLPLDLAEFLAVPLPFVPLPLALPLLVMTVALPMF